MVLVTLMINAAKVYDEMRRRDFWEITFTKCFFTDENYPLMIEQDIKQRSLVVLILNSIIHSEVVVLSFDKLVVAVSSLNGYLLRLKR